MKLLALILPILFFADQSSASSPRISEHLQTSTCEASADSELSQVRYLPRATGAISAKLTYISSASSASPVSDENVHVVEDEFISDLPSLSVSGGNLIIHSATGTVCAKFKKPLIGKSRFVPTSACEVIAVTRSDRRGNCVRDYKLVVW